MDEYIECDGFQFCNNFDSANLAKVEKADQNTDKKKNDGKSENNKNPKVSSSNTPLPNYEFNIWTKYDCQGTEFQNSTKTWFYFGVKAPKSGSLVKFNLVNLNKQVKMFSQGMSPVFKVIPGHNHWERIKDKPTFIADDQNNQFILSFSYCTPENINAITYFAFTYPFSYTDLQNHLKKIDVKVENLKQCANPTGDDIYYHRECAIRSLEGRRLDILTISSYHHILPDREARIKNLFPEKNEERPFKFKDKKIIFVSARVHPGETPSSFVLNGLLNLLLNREDQTAIILRQLYVFKLIPMLNPDGVAQGYYRMDTRGVNLNRLYLNPSMENHPTIYAAKALLRYYHRSYMLAENYISDATEKVEVKIDATNSTSTCNRDFKNMIGSQIISDETNKLLQKVNLMSLEEKSKRIEQGNHLRNCLFEASENPVFETEEEMKLGNNGVQENCEKQEDSGIFLYIDLHSHASKKGIFMYGNHFDDPEDSSACMLLPKLMSINNPNFHFTSCNFAEKNMYIIDKRDGMSREGSGRVAVYKSFGLIHSYTLECNYNTGRVVNTVPARVKERFRKLHSQLYVPPKYNPSVFEEVGAAFGPSILDMTGHNPNSRLPNSQYRSLKGLISYLKLISSNRYQSPKTCLQKHEEENQSSCGAESSSELGEETAKSEKRSKRKAASYLRQLATRSAPMVRGTADPRPVGRSDFSVQVDMTKQVENDKGAPIADRRCKTTRGPVGDAGAGKKTKARPVQRINAAQLVVARKKAPVHCSGGSSTATPVKSTKKNVKSTPSSRASRKATSAAAATCAFPTSFEFTADDDAKDVLINTSHSEDPSDVSTTKPPQV